MQMRETESRVVNACVFEFVFNKCLLRVVSFALARSCGLAIDYIMAAITLNKQVNI